MSTETIRILIYIRVSTKGQAFYNGIRIEDGSLPVQKRRAEDEIKREYESKGIPYKVIEVIEDAGMSARDMERPGFQRLWTLIDQGEVDRVVCSELSRVMRDTFFYLLFKQHCDKNNVKLKFIGSNLDTDDPSGEMLETMMASLATYESKVTGLRIKRNILDRLEKDGKINGAGDLLGLDRCPDRKGHFIRNESEIKDLLRLLHLFLESSSKAEAIRRANAEGITDKGKPFSSFRFNNILKNVEWRYISRYHYVDKKTKQEITSNLDYEPILDESLVYEVVSKREKLKKFQARCGKRNHIYLLSGVLISKDGSPLQGHVGHGRSKDYRYYYSKKSKQRINASLLESQIEERVISYFKNSGHLEKLVQKSVAKQRDGLRRISSEISKLKNKVTELEKQCDRIVEYMTRDDLSGPAIETLSKKLNDVENKKIGLVKKIEEKENLKELMLKKPDISIVQQKIATYSNRFKSLDRSTKRALISQIFEKIEMVDNYSVKLHIKKAPFLGVFPKITTNGCDKQFNGGTCKT
ncbi:MAG: recombinase family protein [Bacteriovoracaceae bacterium]